MNIADKLIFVARGDVSKQIYQRILDLEKDGTDDVEAAAIEILNWGRDEITRRVNEANRIAGDDSLTDTERTDKIFRVMLGRVYDEYVRGYEKETGKPWTGNLDE
jgi:hypothetical protein